MTPKTGKRAPHFWLGARAASGGKATEAGSADSNVARPCCAAVAIVVVDTLATAEFARLLARSMPTQTTAISTFCKFKVWNVFIGDLIFFINQNR
jgi:hypothetical protein